MRYFATVEGGHGNLLSANAAEDIKQKVMANLRRLEVAPAKEIERVTWICKQLGPAPRRGSARDGIPLIRH